MSTPAMQANPIPKHRNWIRTKHHLYKLSLLVSALPLIFGAFAIGTQNGAYFWGPFIAMYVVIPILDAISGKDNANPNDEQIQQLSADAYYVRLMYGATLLHWASLIGAAFFVSQFDWHWFDILGASLSSGVVGGAALVAGHELGHKVKDKAQIWAAKLLLASNGYGHFTIEHNKGHHRAVSTPEDHASSRFGESIYKFCTREVPGAFRRAWSIEAERLERLGKPTWSLSNEIIQPAIITLTSCVLFLAFFGPVMIPFLAIYFFASYWSLTSANYIEHYGLLRLKDENGRYERCQPKHSWNSNHKLSNILTLHLQRHSDHHANPTRAYQVLRDYEDVPQLPLGYFGMYIVAMIPSLWFKVMNHRVIDWAEGDVNKINMDPDYMLKHCPQTTESA